MNKTKKQNYTIIKTLVLFALCLNCTLGYAQPGFGASGSVHLFSKQMGQFISFGPLAEFGFAKGKYSGRPSFNYYLPKTSTGTTTGYYLGNATTGQAVNVNYTERYRIMTLAFDAKRYIRSEDAFMDGGFYAGAGFGFFFEKIKTTYGAYNSQKYYIRKNSSSVSYSQLMFRAFGGYEMTFEFGTLFLETMFIAPLSSANAEGSNIVEVPISLSFQLGYKYHIW